MKLSLVLLLAMLVLLSGCGDEHLAGTHDAAIIFKVTSPIEVPPTKGKGPKVDPQEYLASIIKGRVSAAHVTADVEKVDADHVRVIVDADEVDVVTDLLAWRGGVELHLADLTTVFTPKTTTGLTEKVNGDDHYWVGSRAAIAMAIQGADLGDAMVLSEAIDSQTARTRVVKKEVLMDLHDCIEKVTMHDRGRRLLVHFKAHGDRSVAAAQTLAAGKPVSVVRARASLTTRPIDYQSAPLELSYGTDIYSYSRAALSRTLLESSPLPVLVRESSSRLAADWFAAITAIIIPILLSLGWLFFVRRFDRSHPEPLWLILTTFFFGCLSVIPAALMEYGLMSASPYLNPSVMTLGGQMIGLIPGLIVFSFVVGGAEELSKFMGAWSLARHRREFDEPVDGIIYGAASSLGFAAAENVKYFTVGRLSGVLITTRAFLSVPVHLFFGVIWGYALGRAIVTKKRGRVVLFLVIAAVFHGAFDTFLSIHGMQMFALLVYIFLAMLFVIFLRRALRRGKTPDSSVPVPSEQRWLFAVGSPWLFITYVVLFHLLAIGLFFTSIFFELEHHRIGPMFVGVASGLVVAVGLCMMGMSSTMVMDVAVDAQGVTFAGGLHEWSAIKSAVRGSALSTFGYRPVIRLQTTNGPVVLGPSDVPTCERMLQAISGFLARPKDG